MLPARLDCRLSWSGLGEQCGQWAAVFSADGARHGEVVQAAIVVAQSKHQPRRTDVARHADDGALDRSLTFDLDPITPTTSHIRAINALGDYPFKPGHP